MTKLTIAVLLAGLLVGPSTIHAQSGDAAAWDARAAAAYLDQRVDWWSGWETAARERGTFCVSCHTTGPYGPGPARCCGPPLPRNRATRPERALLDSVTTRVTHWADVAPFYPDERYGAPKTSQSRGTEAILNALVLARQDERTGTLGDRTLWGVRQPVGAAGDERRRPRARGPGCTSTWRRGNRTRDRTTGRRWPPSPWGSHRTATAPAPDIRDNVAQLGNYLRRRLHAQPPFNRVMALWASGSLPDLLPDAQRQAIVDEIVGLQRADGGWSLSALGTWARRDETPVDTQSDGYATGLGHARAAAGRRAAGSQGGRRRPRLAHEKPGARRVVARVVAEPATRFRRRTAVASCGDAATAYAVLALTRGHEVRIGLRTVRDPSRSARRAVEHVA